MLYGNEWKLMVAVNRNEMKKREKENEKERKRN